MGKSAFIVLMVIALPLAFFGCAKSSSSDGPSVDSAPSNNTCHVVPGTAQGMRSVVSPDNGKPLDEPPSPRPGGPRPRLRKLHGHVPVAVKKATDKGKLDEASELAVTLVLDLNNRAELAARLEEMYRPGSPSYHRFISSAEFGARYAPTKDQLDKVREFARAQGLAEPSLDGTGMLMRTRGTTKNLSAAFHTELHRFVARDGSAHFAPAYELQIPDGVPIRAVHGLHDFTRLHAHAQAGAKADPRRSGSGQGGGYGPADIRLAYGIPSFAMGAGQTLAVFELDGYNTSDVTAYEKAFSLPAVALENVLVDGADGSAGADSGEVTLDIELMAALAPKASRILVYEAPNTEQGVLDAYSRIASDNRAKSISTSWGAPEDESSPSLIESENQIFMQMAAQGQTIYAAAGDKGAYDDGVNLTVDDPASQPFVTAVGGTTLTTDTSGQYANETTWSSGGGGVSSAWTAPSWQTNLSTSANGASSSMRNLPDVALNADPATGYAIFVNGTWQVFGGTSCAAPLWAAFNALVNEQRSANGLAPIGYINPMLYEIGHGGAYATNFRDIADHSTNLYYAAVSGFDNATGWGSFSAGALLKTLAVEPTSSVLPSSQFVGTVQCN